MSENAPKTVPGGLVVFFEGIDGVGKTTQLQLAAESLRSEGWSVETTRAHGGTDIGEALREISLSDMERPVGTDLGISVAIHEALAAKVDILRQAGQVVLIDRGPFSMVAYQMYGDGLELERGWQAVEHDLSIFSPELNIVYTAAISVAEERMHKRSGKKANYWESKPAGFFDVAQQGYMDAAERFGGTVIDAEQSIDAVHSQTMEAIRSALESKNK